MTTSTAIELSKPDTGLTTEQLDLMLREAERYVESGLLPSSIKTPAAALLIMKAGRELGIPATYALRNIHVIQGRPTCSAELMMALVHQRYGPGRILVKESTSSRCVVLCRPPGWDIVAETVWTMEDARQAKLDGKETWKQYPRAMLRSRAVSEACRTHFPAAIAGMYTPEELGAAVAVTDEGGVVIVEGQSREVGASNGSNGLAESARERLLEKWRAGLEVAEGLALTVAPLDESAPVDAIAQRVVELGRAVKKAQKAAAETPTTSGDEYSRLKAQLDALEPGDELAYSVTESRIGEAAEAQQITPGAYQELLKHAAAALKRVRGGK